MTFDQRLNEYIAQTETFLDEYLNTDDCVGQESLIDAMRYSALAGGKRLRPTLTMEFCRVCGEKPVDALPFAVALEMIHTYSLIHDDLPCMDNDDMRRGKPTNHKVYGDGMAVLAGDGLLTQAFELMANPRYTGHLPPESVVRAIRILGREAGVLGMIGGQVLDINAARGELDYDALVRLQERKTGALMRAAAHMGCVIGGANAQQIQAANQYAVLLGLAFQIQDDILDLEGDAQVLGKSTGSDAQNDKATFPALLGIPACHDKVRELTHQAVHAVEGVFTDNSFLISLAQIMSDRTR